MNEKAFAAFVKHVAANATDGTIRLNLMVSGLGSMRSMRDARCVVVGMLLAAVLFVVEQKKEGEENEK